MVGYQCEYVVIYLPGMQGEIPLDRWLLRGVRDGGVNDCRIYNWPESWWPLRNLRDRDQHRAAGARLVEMVKREHEEGDNSKVVLMGHSTGAMVILDALEMIEEGLIDQVWLLSAAVCCDYDLRGCVEKTERMVNVYSGLDWLALNVGTRLFGTADGIHGKSAGYAGFCGAGSDDERVEQWVYRMEWLRWWHWGGHLSVLNRMFGREVIGPGIVGWK